MSSLSAAEVLAAAQAELAAAAGVPVSAVSEETVQAMLAALEAEEAEEAEAQGQPRASGSAASPAGTAAGSAPATPPPPAAPGECGGGGDGSEAAAADDGASDLSLERVIIKSSAGPEPFPGIPQLPPRMPAEAGQVLVRFDLEEGHCWELSRAGWCCFWSLACTLPICCCLPCFAPCSLCHARFQRPVYGWPLGCHAEIIAPSQDEDKEERAEGEGAPEEASGGGGGGGSGDSPGSDGRTQDAPRPAALQIPPPMPPASSPSPQSIFLPPSAVPLTGFSIPTPGYPKYKAEPPKSGASSAPCTPRSGFPPPSSPNACGAAAAPRPGSPLTPPVWPQMLLQLPQPQRPTGAPVAASPPQEGHPQRGGNVPAAMEHPRPPAARTARSQQPPAHSLATWGSRQNSRHFSLDGVASLGLP